MPTQLSFKQVQSVNQIVGDLCAHTLDEPQMGSKHYLHPLVSSNALTELCVFCCHHARHPERQTSPGGGTSDAFIFSLQVRTDQGAQSSPELNKTTCMTSNHLSLSLPFPWKVFWGDEKRRNNLLRVWKPAFGNQQRGGRRAEMQQNALFGLLGSKTSRHSTSSLWSCHAKNRIDCLSSLCQRTVQESGLYSCTVGTSVTVMP